MDRAVIGVSVIKPVSAGLHRLWAPAPHPGADSVSDEDLDMDYHAVGGMGLAGRTIRIMRCSKTPSIILSKHLLKVDGG